MTSSLIVLLSRSCLSQVYKGPDKTLANHTWFWPCTFLWDSSFFLSQTPEMSELFSTMVLSPSATKESLHLKTKVTFLFLFLNILFQLNTNGQNSHAFYTKVMVCSQIISVPIGKKKCKPDKNLSILLFILHS